MMSRDIAMRMKYYKQGQKVCDLADKKLDNLKFQREIKAVLLLELCQIAGVNISSTKAEEVENLINLIDSLISLKIQCFNNDFRENPLPCLFYENKHSKESEILYNLTSSKPKKNICQVCGGEFIPLALGNLTCGECLLKGGKAGGGKC